MKRNTWKWCWYVGVVIVAALVTDMMSVNCWAQLDVKSSYTLGEPIIVKMAVPEKPEGAVLRKDKFKVIGAAAVKVDDATWHIWALPGKYTVEATGEWRLYQTIISKDDKEYKVIADEDDYEFTASFEVTGGVTPPPPPPPPPPPIQGGPYQIWMLFDAEAKDNLPKQQQAILGSLAFRLKLEKAGHRVLGVSAAQSITDPAASKYAAYFEAAKNVPLPCLIVSGMQGGKCVAMPLPADEDATEKLLTTELLK